MFSKNLFSLFQTLQLIKIIFKNRIDYNMLRSVTDFFSAFISFVRRFLLTNGLHDDSL